jgi:hypothetical protein
MKNLIAWASLLAVLSVLADNLSTFLEEQNLVSKIVAAIIVFSFALRFLIEKEPAKGKGKVKRRSSARRPASQPRTDRMGIPGGSHNSNQTF